MQLPSPCQPASLYRIVSYPGTKHVHVGCLFFSCFHCLFRHFLSSFIFLKGSEKKKKVEMKRLVIGSLSIPEVGIQTGLLLASTHSEHPSSHISYQIHAKPKGKKKEHRPHTYLFFSFFFLLGFTVLRRILNYKAKSMPFFFLLFFLLVIYFVAS